MFFFCCLKVLSPTLMSVHDESALSLCRIGNILLLRFRLIKRLRVCSYRKRERGHGHQEEEEERSRSG